MNAHSSEIRGLSSPKKPTNFVAHHLPLEVSFSVIFPVSKGPKTSFVAEEHEGSQKSMESPGLTA